jgi:hypothetical protein
MVMQGVKLEMGYCPERDRYWFSSSYNPEFIERFMAETTWPSRVWDPKAARWWITEEVLWGKFEQLGQEFKYWEVRWM